MRTSKSSFPLILVIMTAVATAMLCGDPIKKDYKPMLADGLGAEIKNLLDPKRAKREAEKTDLEVVNDARKEILNNEKFAEKHYLEAGELEA